MAIFGKIILAVTFFALPITASAAVTFSRDSRVARISNGTLTVGIDKLWGGAIREISLNGQNVINTFDAGRLMAVAVYDGNQSYPANPGDPAWGWNATISDKYNHANPPLAVTFSQAGELYVKTQLVQWNPDRLGGGPQQSISTDVILETRVSFLPSSATGLEIRYRITHTGTDSHGTRIQESPYVYLDPAFHTLTTAGAGPAWMLGPLASFDITVLSAGLPLHEIAAPEEWLSASRSDGLAVTLWAPAGLPAFRATHHVGDPGYSDIYLIPEVEAGFPAMSSREQTVYAFIGPVAATRSAIYGLHPDSATAALPRLVSAVNDPTVYEIVNNQRHRVPTPGIVRLLSQTEGPVVTILPDELVGLPRARLITTATSPTVYYLTESNMVRPIPSPAVLKSYGNLMSDVITVRPEELKLYPKSTLIYSPDTKRVYLLQGNVRRWIRPAVFKRRHYSWSRVAPVNAAELKAYREGKPLK